mgnify:CR=1 FL=1
MNVLFVDQLDKRTVQIEHAFTLALAYYATAKIDNLHEYQDAWGFLRVVETEARQMTESDDPDIAAAGREILAHLEPTGTAFGDLQGKGSFTMDPSILMGRPRGSRSPAWG